MLVENEHCHQVTLLNPDIWSMAATTQLLDVWSNAAPTELLDIWSMATTVQQGCWTSDPPQAATTSNAAIVQASVK